MYFFFQASVLFSIETAFFRYWPILAILSRIYALFGVHTTGLNSAVVYQNWQIQGRTADSVYNVHIVMFWADPSLGWVPAVYSFLEASQFIVMLCHPTFVKEEKTFMEMSNSYKIGNNLRISISKKKIFVRRLIIWIPEVIFVPSVTGGREAV